MSETIQHAAPSVFRFAPSPNGRLHLGHALSALIGFEMAQRVGGRFLLRIEDIDTTRSRPEFIAGIFEDLAWLGLIWEEPVLLQSAHFAVYREAIDRLGALGVLYPCVATRTEINAASVPTWTDPDGTPLYTGRGRVLSVAETEARMLRGDPYTLRLDMERARDIAKKKRPGEPLTFRAFDAVDHVTDIPVFPERWGDAIIVRRDTPSSYHLSVVVDDARQGVTHVTRGLAGC